MFGSGVVCVQIAGHHIHTLCVHYSNHCVLSECHLVMIVSFVSCPLLILGAPSDISWLAYGASGSTILATIIFMILLGIQGHERLKTHTPSYTKNINYTSVFLAIGAIAFGYGGTATIPTFRNHMKGQFILFAVRCNISCNNPTDSSKFGRAIYASFICLIIIYFVISAAGFAVFGSEVKDSILDNFDQSNWSFTMSLCLMVFHLFCAYLLLMNMVNMSLEETIGIPKKFTRYRLLFRVYLALIVIFTCISIPKFGKVVNFVGGSAFSITTYILPPIVYLKLAKIHERSVTIIEKYTLILISVFGLFASIVATYASLFDIISPGSFTTPCYVLE